MFLDPIWNLALQGLTSLAHTLLSCDRRDALLYLSPLAHFEGRQGHSQFWPKGAGLGLRERRRLGQVGCSP